MSKSNNITVVRLFWLLKCSYRFLSHHSHQQFFCTNTSHIITLWQTWPDSSPDEFQESERKNVKRNVFWETTFGINYHVSKEEQKRNINLREVLLSSLSTVTTNLRQVTYDLVTHDSWRLSWILCPLFMCA